MMRCLNKLHCKNELILWLFFPELDLHWAYSPMDKCRLNEWNLNVVFVDVVIYQLLKVDLVRISTPFWLNGATS